MAICESGSSFYVIRLLFGGNDEMLITFLRHLFMMIMHSGGLWPFFSLLPVMLSFSSSEGIQVGNVGSAAGIIGSWTGASHDHGSFLSLTASAIGSWIHCCFTGDPVGEHIEDIANTD